jgi:hypothetical protein
VRQKIQPYSAAGSSKDESSFADLVTGILKIGMRKKRFQVCVVEILCNKLIFFSFFSPKVVIDGLTLLKCVPTFSLPNVKAKTSVSQHDFNATQVPPEWHSWIQHIRKDPPTRDLLMQKLTPPWKAVRFILFLSIHRLSKKPPSSHITRI